MRDDAPASAPPRHAKAVRPGRLGAGSSRPGTEWAAAGLCAPINGVYPIADAMVKIGKYIAITMNPMIVPRNTIIKGSSNDVRAATA